MYAIIETGGKQYQVEEGQSIFVEKLNVEEGSKVSFDKVLLVSKDGDIKVGSPLVEGAKVEGTVERHGRGKKVIIFKFKAKKNYRKKKGHRQPFTKVKIESIAFPKNPVTNIFKSKFFFNKELIPPKTESNAAIIAIAKYPEYV